MRQILFVTLAVIGAVSIIAAGFTLNHANQEQLALTARLQSRTQLLADSLAESVTPAFRSYATSSLQATLDKFIGKERVQGLGVFDAAGESIAFSGHLPTELSGTAIVVTAMDSGSPADAFMHGNDGQLYAFAQPLLAGDHMIGALVVVQNAQYINDAVLNIWRDNLLRLGLQLIFVAAAIYALVRWVFYRPLMSLAESIRSVRSGKADDTDDAAHALFVPLAAELSKMTRSLRQARTAASEEARMRLQKLDSPWTAERLAEFIKAYHKDRPIFVLSNGEPYVHTKEKGGITCTTPAGGVITALDPLMQSCGGVWIVNGGGSADKAMSDKDGKLRVPPDEPRYTLKRVFLSERETRGYYVGFSNEALWPLSHLAHVRPQFRKEDWIEYRKVNGLFAKALLEEVRHVEQPIILVQDYHLALVPALIKKSKPDARVAFFWHIPWPSAAQFSICPWRKEILRGILGADLVGFHTQQYCNNFTDTVANELETRIDYERFAIVCGGHETRVEPFPISIAFPGEAEPESAPDPGILEHLNINASRMALGVDRLDYIKGIMERFRGIEFLLDTYPKYRGELTLLQIASPTREAVEKYREYAHDVAAEAQRINERFGTREWSPIRLEHKHYSHRELRALYQLADVCLVTSLHDGMNLVAKEYVAARTDERGVLILSNFTGASRDLHGALIVNPYSAEETAQAIHEALAMPESEQKRRMKVMRASVRDYNVYRWSAEIIKTLMNAS